QYVSAQDNNAYDNIDMQRSLMLFKDDEFSNPLLIDIFTVSSPDSSQYDLPLWFNGHLLSANFNYDKALEVQESMGDTAGYQHIWMEAVGTPSSESTQICWFNNGRFYSMTSVSKQDDQLIFGRAGASDPNFNLRHDPVFIQRRDVAGTTSFVNIIEVHGTYDPITEIPAEPFSNISSLDIIHEDDSYIIIAFSDFEKNEWTAAMTKTDFGKENKHEIELDNKKLWWTGPFKIFKNN
ncbi:MAG: heparinase, partial [Bacteroidia bacterium]|nr:heparinase [Bacteroidia bacterium]